MKPPKNVTLVKAKYHSDYKYKFTFSNGKESVVNFKPVILFNNKHLLDVTKFRKMKIQNQDGDINWGEDWDMCFHIDSYYNEKSVRPFNKKKRNEILKQLRPYMSEPIYISPVMNTGLK